MSNRPKRVAAFVESLTKEMLAFCGPIFITPGLKTYPGQMVDNGTYSLLDTGRKMLLVTCYHVWQAYLDYRVKTPEAVLCLNLGEGDASVAFALPERQLIDSDPGLDLAVFDFDPNSISLDKAKVNQQKDWFRIERWPIPKVGSGDFVVLMGFPGKRVKKAGQLCRFTAQAIPPEGYGRREQRNSHL